MDRIAGEVTARLFHASEFVKAVQHKEETGGILLRTLHPTMGVMYEVRYLPPDKSPYRDID